MEWRNIVRHPLPDSAHDTPGLIRRWRQRDDFSFIMWNGRIGETKTPFMRINTAGDEVFDSLFRPRYFIPDVYFHVLHNAKLLEGGIVIDQTGRAIYPTTYHARGAGWFPYQWHDSFSEFFLEWTGWLSGPEIRETKKIPGEYFLFSTLPGLQYAHWFIQELPHVMFLRRLSTAGLHGETIPLAVTKDFSSFTKRHMEMLEVNNPVSVFSPAEQPLEFERLIVPSLHRMPHLSGFPSEPVEIYRELRLRADRFDEPSPERIFLNRKDMGGRRGLHNEGEIQDIAVRYGFEPLDITGWSADRQIHAYSKTKIIAGIHGAAFTNMVFAPQNATILELTHSKIASTIFYRLAGICGHDYGYLCGEPRQEDLEKDSQTYKFWIDPLVFEQNLAQTIQVDDAKR